MFPLPAPLPVPLYVRSLDIMRADFWEYALSAPPSFSLALLARPPPRSPPQPHSSLHAQSGQRSQAGESALIYNLLTKILN